MSEKQKQSSLISTLITKGSYLLQLDIASSACGELGQFLIGLVKCCLTQGSIDVNEFRLAVFNVKMTLNTGWFTA